MTTQKFMGKNQLIDRLAAQVGNRDTAIGILQKRGHLKRQMCEILPLQLLVNSFGMLKQ
jgi:hypothetical protein